MQVWSMKGLIFNFFPKFEPIFKLVQIKENLKMSGNFGQDFGPKSEPIATTDSPFKYPWFQHLGLIRQKSMITKA